MSISFTEGKDPHQIWTWDATQLVMDLSDRHNNVCLCMDMKGLSRSEYADVSEDSDNKSEVFVSSAEESIVTDAVVEKDSKDKYAYENVQIEKIDARNSGIRQAADVLSYFRAC